MNKLDAYFYYSSYHTFQNPDLSEKLPLPYNAFEIIKFFWKTGSHLLLF